MTAAVLPAAGTPGTAPVGTERLAEADWLRRHVVARVDAFRERQGQDGGVTDPTGRDTELLLAVRDAAVSWYTRHELTDQAEALHADVADWCARGLDTAPDFARSRDALRAPADGTAVFFLAAVRTTNSVPPVGRRLECFYAVRREPRVLPQLATTHPHPKNNCQSLVLVTGSAGFAHGNCLVFFPENVASRDKVREQTYAMFFYNKMRRIHATYALPGAEAVLTPGSVPRGSTGLDADTCFEARAVWGYLHDSLHYQGLWPFDQHITLKMNWFVGLLEETKVDCRTVLACVDEGVPYAREMTAMVLLERVFRYPQAEDATRNFDSGTGVLLYSWLREHGALTGDPAGGGLLTLDHGRTVAALRAFVAAVEELEATVADDDAYRAAALAFVRRYLPEGEPRQRYRFTEDQRVLLRARDALAGLPPLRFDVAEW